MICQVRRPVERGYLVNSDLQRDIWANLLAEPLHCGPSDTSLLLTEPLFNLPSIQESVDQVQRLPIRTLAPTQAQADGVGVQLPTTLS